MLDLTTVITTTVGIGATWFFSRYYSERKARKNPQSVVDPTIKMNMKTKRTPKGDAHHDMTFEPELQFFHVVPIRWALQLLNAYRSNEIFFPDLCMAASQLDRAARALRQPFDAANKAVPDKSIDHPRTFHAWHDVWNAEIEKARQTLARELQSLPKSFSGVGSATEEPNPRLPDEAKRS